jgi:hypothetical protein
MFLPMPHTLQNIWLLIDLGFTVRIVLNTVTVRIVLNTVTVCIVLNTVTVRIVLNTVTVRIVLNTVPSVRSQPARYENQCLYIYNSMTLPHCKAYQCLYIYNSMTLPHCKALCKALDRGRIGVFYAFKMPKTHWR